MKVIVVGGGPAGFSAATSAKRAGAEVVLLERADMLGGLGLMTGGAITNACHIPLAEARAMGGAEFYDLTDSIVLKKRILGTPQGWAGRTFDVTRLDGTMQRWLRARGVDVKLCQQVVNVDMAGDRVKAVVLKGGGRVEGDAFVDATGATTGVPGCEEFAWGCVGCVLRCHAFGNPGGIVDKKVKTVSSLNHYGKPTTTGTSVILAMNSLAPNLRKELKATGTLKIPVPPGLEPNMDRYYRASSTRSGVSDMEGMKINLVFHDIGGFAKLYGSGAPLYAHTLRKVPGLEDAMICQPTAGAKGNMAWMVAMAYCANTLKVDGFENVFCAGTKSGPHHSIIDAVATGDLAGHNAVRCALKQELLVIPRNLVIGAVTDLVCRNMRTEEGLKRRYSMKAPDLMRELNVFREDKKQIIREVKQAGLTGVYQKKLC